MHTWVEACQNFNHAAQRRSFFKYKIAINFISKTWCYAKFSVVYQTR